MMLALPFSFVAGHVVGFALGHRFQGETAADEAGHGYLASLGKVAIPLLLVTLMIALWAGARHRAFRPRFGSTAGQFAAVFVGIELIEHVNAGWSFWHIVSDPALWVGILTQLLVAALVVGLLRVLVRVGERLSLAAPLLASPRIMAVPAPALVLVSGVALTPIRRRGPPGSLVHI